MVKVPNVVVLGAELHRNWVIVTSVETTEIFFITKKMSQDKKSMVETDLSSTVKNTGSERGRGIPFYSVSQ